MLEAAVFSLPVLTGPNVHNFLEISQLLEDAHALIMVKNAEDLADEMIEIFTNSDLKQSLGLNAKSVIEANGGSLQKHLDIIETLLA